MDSVTSDNTASRPLRRSTRQSSGKALNFEPTPRGPLKRTKKSLVNRAPVAAVNGSGDVENGSEDEESPTKKSRLQTGGPDTDGDENEMDVQESVEDLEKNEDQAMEIALDSSHGISKQIICQGPYGDLNLSPLVVLGERCKPSLAVNEAKRAKPSTKEPVASTKSPTQIRPLLTRHDVPISKSTSMDEYKRKMEAKVKSIAIPAVNHHVPSTYPASAKSYTTRRRVNNIPTQKEPAKESRHEKQGIKKTAVIKRSAAHSSKGFMWYFWGLVLLLLLCSFTILLAHKVIRGLQITAHDGEWASSAVKLEKFADRLTLLKTQFPSQRPELWKRCKIHLEKHLKTAKPTEPVSLIFTAGPRAERTLRCLAQSLASSFSSALNASVLLIDGASKADQDSDEVKLDIDTQLQAAFEGDTPVAVIHRFEELPPGSTLIFYRYCDHENAAYRHVFLLFTVLLQDEVRAEQSLKEVEEMVQDFLKERLVGSNNQMGFNKMDNDKYGGLWSRISHLILPVVSETDVEQKEC